MSLALLICVISNQNAFTLQLFTGFNKILKTAFLLNCTPEFIKFLSECLINILSGVVLMPRDGKLQRFHAGIVILSGKEKDKKKPVSIK